MNYCLAMEAVIAGNRFLSAKLAGRPFETDGRCADRRGEIRRHEAGVLRGRINRSSTTVRAGLPTAALDARERLLIMVVDRGAT